MYILKANSGDTDQTPRSAASDLGLHCLPMSHKKDANRLKWVNITIFSDASRDYVVFCVSTTGPV